jgi:hypothetical protein
MLRLPQIAMQLSRLALLASLAFGWTARADDGMGGGLDLGFGGMHTQPFIVGGAVCASLGLELHRAILSGPVNARLELRATAGSGLNSGIPESAQGGNQTLATALAGIELVNAHNRRGPFVDLGLGIGRSTISAARGPTRPPNWGFVPLKDRTAAAYGVGIGYRFGARSRWALGQVALRTTGLFNNLTASSSEATVLSLGWTF